MPWPKVLRFFAFVTLMVGSSVVPVVPAAACSRSIVPSFSAVELEGVDLAELNHPDGPLARKYSELYSGGPHTVPEFVVTGALQRRTIADAGPTWFVSRGSVVVSVATWGEAEAGPRPVSMYESNWGETSCGPRGGGDGPKREPSRTI